MLVRTGCLAAALLVAGCSAVGPEAPLADLCRDAATLATPPTDGRNVRVEAVGSAGDVALDLASLDAATDYPEFAWRAEIEGTVRLRVTVDAARTVTEAVVVDSPNELLSEAAVAGARATRGVLPGAAGRADVAVTFVLCG